MKRQLLRLITVTPLLFASLMLTPSAEAAGEIGLSRDGVTWSSSLQGNLFDQIGRWVPGDLETRSFYVRNQGSTQAFLDIEVRSVDTDKLLEYEDINLRARADSGPWFNLKNAQASKSLVSQGIPRGDKVRVDVRAIFDPASPNRSQNKSVALSFNVRLYDSLEDVVSDETTEHGGAGHDGTGHDESALLPSTGSMVKWWFVWAGAILTGTGLALVRRRREEKSANV